MEKIKNYMKPGSISDEETFENLVEELWKLHWDRNPVYKESTLHLFGQIEAQGWRSTPCMPISRFKENKAITIGTEKMPPKGELFQSSGTTQGDKSTHYLPYTDLYEASIAGSFLHLVLKEFRWLPGYNVVTVSPHVPQSSLLWMMDFLREQLGSWKLMVDPTKSEDLAELELLLQDSFDLEIPLIMFGTSLAMYDLFQKNRLNRPDDQPLHHESKIITTGGWKGRNIEISQYQLEGDLSYWLGLSRFNMMREYSMSEMSSQLYAYAAEVPEYKSMPWLRYRVVDPLTQKDVKEGEHGAIAFYDLANAYSCPFILTEDEGSIGPNGGLILHGRLGGAVEKGCSISVGDALGNKHRGLG